VTTLLAAVAAGCPKQEPEPVKVERDDPAQRRADSPFNNPKRDPPGPRQPAQLTGEALESHLAEARRQLAAGEPIRAMQMLYSCANKEPPSVRCDAELGILLLEQRTRKAHAEYFIAEAIRLDEPEADSDLYRRLADVARRRGRFAVAIDAIQRVIDRGEATADDFVTLSHALQADPKRLDEAIAALAKAYELNPEAHDWLLERATLVAQTPDVDTAIAILEQYKATLDADSPERSSIDERIDLLRAPTAKKE
jgi:tetratricopeptide (TPR) repeat protein